MTILDVRKGGPFRVKRVNLARAIGKRLADMGFVQGAEGFVVRRAIFGGPLQIRICHYDVSIRRSEASGIEIEPLEGQE